MTIIMNVFMMIVMNSHVNSLFTKLTEYFPDRTLPVHNTPSIQSDSDLGLGLRLLRFFVTFFAPHISLLVCGT